MEEDKPNLLKKFLAEIEEKYDDDDIIWLSQSISDSLNLMFSSAFVGNTDSKEVIDAAHSLAAFSALLTQCIGFELGNIIQLNEKAPEGNQTNPEAKIQLSSNNQSLNSTKI